MSSASMPTGPSKYLASAALPARNLGCADVFSPRYDFIRRRISRPLLYPHLSRAKSAGLLFCVQALESSMRNDYIRLQESGMKIEWGICISSGSNPDKTHGIWVALLSCKL